MGSPRRASRSRGFAHYPWRDRNVRAAKETETAHTVRSLPLEGSQPGDGTGENMIGVVRSLPLEGSQPVNPDVASNGAGRFAHYPWRDRNAATRPSTSS